VLGVRCCRCCVPSQGPFYSNTRDLQLQGSLVSFELDSFRNAAQSQPGWQAVTGGAEGPAQHRRSSSPFKVCRGRAGVPHPKLAKQ